MKYILVIVTCPAKNAEKIARKILSAKVAACVNISAEIKSIYRWKGKVEVANEKILLIKTRQSLYSSLEKIILKVHPYQVPEIIALPLIHGHKPYLDWIGNETTHHKSRQY
jgi:periplasmic divalent cation tolerance protein